MSVDDFDGRKDELLPVSRHVRDIVRDGYEWCASVDLAAFFDEIPHNLILKLIRRKIRDERLVTLIARALKAGIMADGQFEKTVKGCPQGSLCKALHNVLYLWFSHRFRRQCQREAFPSFKSLFSLLCLTPCIFHSLQKRLWLELFSLILVLDVIHNYQG